ncbi:MAG: MMPL family transporter, partial [Bacilli bacterium]
QSQEDLKKAELIGLPIAFLVLFLAFGSLAASLLPIVLGALSVLVTFGVLTFVGEEMELSVFVLNVAPMIGLALSIDFALLFVSRYREELKQNSVKESIAIAYSTAGRAIIFSGLCVFIGLSALFIIDIELFQSVAISGATVVFVSIILSLTVLPATLGLLGKRIDWGTIPALTRFQERSGANIWRKFANWVMRRPVLMALSATIILLVCLIPVRSVVLNVPTIDALPASAESRIAYEKYEAAFLPDMKAHANFSLLLEQKEDLFTADGLKRYEAFVQTLKDDPEVDKVASVFDVLGMGADDLTLLLSTPNAATVQPIVAQFVKDNYAFVQVYLNDEPKDNDAKVWLREQDEKWSNTNNAEGFNVIPGGTLRFEQELFDEITSKIVAGLAIILISTFFILMVAFRSVLIPLKAILMNILSLTATFGIVTWLFQDGHFGLPESYIMLILPVFIFGLVFGLSMDYEVFLISRMYELYNETGDNDYSTREGLVSTSRIITSAATIMIVVTGAFAFTDLVPVKQMGIGIAIAIFLDATIVRLVLVPSLMKLLGDWNWWMPFRKGKKVKAN